MSQVRSVGRAQRKNNVVWKQAWKQHLGLTPSRVGARLTRIDQTESGRPLRETIRAIFNFLLVMLGVLWSSIAATRIPATLEEIQKRDSRSLCRESTVTSERTRGGMFHWMQLAFDPGEFMTDPALDKELTRKYLVFLGDTAESILATPIIEPEAIDALQRNFEVFQQRLRSSPFVPGAFTAKVESISLDYSTPIGGWDDFWEFCVWLVDSSDERMPSEAERERIKRIAVQGFSSELDVLFRTFDRFHFGK
jgi:hypothetical protein